MADFKVNDKVIVRQYPFKNENDNDKNLQYTVGNIGVVSRVRSDIKDRGRNSLFVHFPHFRESWFYAKEDLIIVTEMGAAIYDQKI